MSNNITMNAGAALEAGRFVKLSGGNAVYCGAGEKALGVTVEAADANHPVTVCVLGAVKVDAAVALGKGVSIQSDANGRAIVLAAGVEAGVVKDAGLAPAGGAFAKAEVVLR